MIKTIILNGRLTLYVLHDPERGVRIAGVMESQEYSATLPIGDADIGVVVNTDGTTIIGIDRPHRENFQVSVDTTIYGEIDHIGLQTPEQE